MIDRPRELMSDSKPSQSHLDTTALHRAALCSLSLPPQPPPNDPVTPPPAALPHNKLIPRTRFVVDGFKHADSKFSVSYFLSHFHSDHYTGLTPQWAKGIIYCSSVTANLLKEILKIPQPLIYPLPLSQPMLIDGSEVWLVDANHCPGAVQFLFKVPVDSEAVVGFEKYVHTGDFRYCAEMKNEAAISHFIGADALFLDTTYCNPKFMFPSQEESIDYIVSVIEKLGVQNEGEDGKNVLFLVATYVIGKEKILMEISRRCKRKIHVSSKKMAVLHASGLVESGVFTEDESESDVHVVGWKVLGETWPYFRPNFVKMQEVMSERGYSKVVGFVPTGWTYEVKHNKFAVRTKDSFDIHLVPYSEHSNYDELREYVRFLKPKRVIPTVGADVEKIDSKHANAMQKHFAGLVDELAVKKEFLMGFLRGGIGAIDVGEKDSSLVSDKITDKEAEDTFSASNCECDVELEKERKLSCPQEEPSSRDSEDLNKNDLEKSVKELQDCLPSWVTLCQMLELLSSSGGNVVEAVSNFYEHETEFHERVVPSTSIPFSSQETSENHPPLAFESRPVASINQPTCVSLSQSFKLSNCSNKSGKSPVKRKGISGGKGTKKARADLTQIGSKQHPITKFFNKKMQVISEDCEVEVKLNNFRDEQSKFHTEAINLYKDEVDQFIQIVDGGESLRSYATSILEKTKGDINMALDTYYNDRSGKSDSNLSDSDKLDSACTSGTCSLDRDAEQLKSNKLEIKSDISFPASRHDEPSANFISLPPERYFPIEHACWRKGQLAPYIHIARTLDLVEGEKGKLKAISMLCNMFRSLLVLSPEDVLPTVYLCTNKITPEHENVELNIGGSIIEAALEEACGANRSKIRNLYNTLGDLGDVALHCRQRQSLLAPPTALTIREVYSVLRKISIQTGSGSTTRKKSLIVNLLCSCREKEMKFIVRTLIYSMVEVFPECCEFDSWLNNNTHSLHSSFSSDELSIANGAGRVIVDNSPGIVRNLRIGAMMRTILPALAQAIVMNTVGLAGNSKDHVQDLLIPCLMEKGIDFSSSTISMVPGVPIKPMLAKITNGAPQVLKIFKDRSFTCEYKYDGQRAQIHRLPDGSIHVFSRNGDETTGKFPDVVDIVKESCAHGTDTFILDAEVVAIDRTNNLKLMSFQELSSRERGSKESLIAVDKIKVDVCIFVFDIMFANGEQLLNLPLRQRRKYLKNLFGEEKLGYLEYAREMTVESHDADVENEDTLNRMNKFLDNALNSSCEGIMVKSLDIDAGYTPSKRLDAWLKVKRDYVEGLCDSLDLVPIGAWHGNGRKAGWFSPFLLACYNPDTEEYQSVCRVMSGFSDAFYKEMKEFFSGDKILSKKPPDYRTSEAPDMWFTPEVVWQIRGAEFTVSPVHHAAMGLVHPSRGISIRFPRFIGPVADRKPDECSTAADVAHMFSLQTRKMKVKIND
ncbi:DNA ligase [Striga asiatica]|uniref:DNA ligase n=1 Tax=Striga asiatica TaxID=4170 RepID=A0A5A7PSJ6_STRAF|nr:DNA ligase [Striga asiatica]